MTIWIGIDPGKTGGMAAILTDRLLVAPLKPLTPQLVLEWLLHFQGLSTDTHCVLEAVRPNPHIDGKKSIWSLSGSYHELRMALLAAEIPTTEVSPLKWQAHFCLRGKWESQTVKKNAHKAKAQQLFPSLKVTHATADALLLADYCRRVVHLPAVV
jgi:hypothetical protein